MADLKSQNTFSFTGYMNDAEAHAYFDKALKMSIYDKYNLNKYCDELFLPKNNGKTMTFRTLGKMTTNNLPLIEGVVPKEDEPMKIYEHTVTLADMGGYATYTDQMDVYNLNSGWGARIQENQSQAVGEVFQDKVKNIFYSSKNRWFAGVTGADLSDLATARSKVTAFNIDDLRKIRPFLKRSKVDPMEGGDYIVLISPEVSADILTLAKDKDNFTFVEIANYQQNTTQLYGGEIGRWMGFRFVETDAIGEIAEGVHGCVILGKYRGEKGAKIVKLEGMGEPVTILHKPGEGGAKVDPINQIGSIGWKCTGWGGIVQYSEAVLIYECKATTIGEEVAPETRDNFTAGFDGKGGTVSANTSSNTLVNGNKIAGYIVSILANDGKSIAGQYLFDGTVTTDNLDSIKADLGVDKLYSDKACSTEVTTEQTITANTKYYIKVVA